MTIILYFILYNFNYPVQLLYGTVLHDNNLLILWLGRPFSVHGYSKLLYTALFSILCAILCMRFIIYPVIHDALAIICHLHVTPPPYIIKSISLYI
jgi:hypothetical protein